MRSTAGIVAGLFFVGIVANCGGDDSSSNGPKAGASNAGEGGEGINTGATSPGGAPNAGMPSSSGGEGGMVPLPSGCTKDADCGKTAKCVDAVCLRNDGQACESAADCQNNCIDEVCTSGKADGEDCSVDEDCAHTCIDNVCAAPSSVGGDCDVDLGAGGAGGAGAGGASSGGAVGTAGAGGEGTTQIPQARDCEAPLQCFAGKCLTPNAEACKDNVDCVNTCVNSVCEPKGNLNDACDDNSDCATSSLICDPSAKVCKLDLKEQCTDNAQCSSNRCLCADDHCVTRTCKTPTSVCQCRWSPADSASCDNTSAPTAFGSQDPNGCAASSANVCGGQGDCVPNKGGDCSQKCQKVTNGDDGKPNTGDEICANFGNATGCNTGYHAAETPNGACQPVPVKVYQADGTTFDHYDYPCQAVCSCDPNN